MMKSVKFDAICVKHGKKYSGENVDNDLALMTPEGVAQIEAIAEQKLVGVIPDYLGFSGKARTLQVVTTITCKLHCRNNGLGITLVQGLDITGAPGIEDYMAQEAAVEAVQRNAGAERQLMRHWEISQPAYMAWVKPRLLWDLIRIGRELMLTHKGRCLFTGIFAGHSPGIEVLCGPDQPRCQNADIVIYTLTFEKDTGNIIQMQSEYLPSGF